MARSLHGGGGVTVAVVVAVVAAAAATLCAAQMTTAPLAMPSCPAAPISLSPCIGYVFGVGSATLSSCCAQLQTFLQSQGPCLCAASKLAAAGPIGVFLGQAQAMLPNVCNLPSNPCDVVAAKSSEPTSTAAPPATPAALAPTAATTSPTPAVVPDTPAMAPSTTPASPEAPEAPSVPAKGSPATMTAPGQVVPGDDGSSSGSQARSKMPELLHSAGGLSSRNTVQAAGSVLITLFLAHVSSMYV
ncbi:hypothetical protein GUJ93_ZPchr0003g18237 [Zizania palustris]|uniref:Bifunctional inhibitor/plant lipid transfer protein/seed storage helical domain-containing protein n=1 Tax=Zizania palustris TaxID=103762 RepID=A0A8J5RNT3_ZIZPA|nr:hypothetical protein GUJ93_ZPchr0003g18237 [Zizania palustris]